MPSFAEKAAAIRCMTSVRSTAHTSIANASMRFRWREGTKCRSASSAWYISPPPCAAVLGPARNDDLVSPSGAAASAAGPRPTLSIGEVLSQLRGDFPDITISKIRFLETDVARLRYVLGQQRDHYLPLRVIKDQLDAMDRGLVSAQGGVPRVPHLAIADNAPTADHFVPAAAT